MNMKDLSKKKLKLQVSKFLYGNKSVCTEAGNFIKRKYRLEGRVLASVYKNVSIKKIMELFIAYTDDSPSSLEIETEFFLDAVYAATNIKRKNPFEKGYGTYYYYWDDDTIIATLKDELIDIWEEQGK